MFVMILKLSINKVIIILISHIISLTFHLGVVKTSKPKDKQLCTTVHTISNNICDTDPLDNSSIEAQI